MVIILYYYIKPCQSKILNYLSSVTEDGFRLADVFLNLVMRPDDSKNPHDREDLLPNHVF